MRRLAALATVVLLLVGASAPALAAGHAVLSATYPGQGQQLGAPPGEVDLQFTGDVLQLGSRVQVLGPAGPVTQGSPQVAGPNVKQPLASGLPAGAYVVNWRVVHDDGHKDAGVFNFTVTAGARPGVTAAAAASSVVPVASADDPADKGLPPFWVGVGFAVVALVVVLAVVLERRQTRSGT